MSNGNSESSARGAAPMHASYRLFSGFLAWLAGMPELPQELDRSLAGGNYSGTAWSSLMSGLQFLGLTDGMTPRPELNELVNSHGDQRKRQLEAILRKAYGDDFISSASSMTAESLDRRLEQLGSTQSARRSAANFFTNAIKDTNVDIPAELSQRTRTRARGLAEVTPSAPTSTAAPDGQSVKVLTLRGNRKVSLVADFDVLSADPQDLDWLVSIVKMFDEKQRELDEANG